MVATDIRGCRQVVEDGTTGILVPLHNADALALAIAELAGDAPWREAMGARARQKAEAEFDDRTVIARTLAAYGALPPPTTSWTRARMRSRTEESS
ncbi:MAG: glycosyltransferase [Acidimicrobiales bacterium]